VAGPGAGYFTDVAGLETQLTSLLADPGRLADMAEASRARHAQTFTQRDVLDQHLALLRQWLPAAEGWAWHG
jgi:hypothetical protein